MKSRSDKNQMAINYQPIQSQMNKYINLAFSTYPRNNYKQAIMFEGEISPDQVDEKYDELLSEYTKLKEEVKELGTEKQIQIELDRVLSQLKSAKSEEKAQFILQEEDPNLDASINELKKMIQFQDAQIAQQKQKNNDTFKELNEKINKKKAQLQSLESQGSKPSASVKELQNNKKKLLEEISNATRIRDKNQEILNLTLKQKAEAEQKLSFILKEQSSKSAAADDLRKSIETLKGEAEKAEGEVEILKKQLNQLQSVQKSTNAETPEQISKEIGIISDKIKAKEASISQLQKKQAIEYENLSKAEKQRKAATGQENKLKEQLQENRAKQAKLRKVLDEIAAERQKIYAEKKTKKKAFDFKTETIRLKKQNQMLERERERGINKLQELIEVKKTYVKPDQLAELKEELDKYKILCRPLEESRQKLTKLTITQTSLVEKIAALKKAEKRIINEKQAHLAQSKEKLKELAENKIFYELNINHCQVKLAEYMKEYPNYEQEKLALKHAEKEKKAKEKQEFLEKLKKKEKAPAKKEKQNEEEDAPRFLPTLDTDSGSSVVANQNYIYGGIALVVLLLIIGYYLI